jgi:hypothetical protein
MGITFMMSEKRFAEVYTAFWQELLPTGERFIRQTNLGLQRYAPPLSSSSAVEERGMVNELAFRLFCEWLKVGLDRSAPVESLSEITQDTVDFILRFRDSTLKKTVTASEKGTKEAIELARRLRQFFTSRPIKSELLPFPQFDGCGFIDPCEGDLFGGATLYEVKAGDRGFRLVDFRQVLVYCALNHTKKKYPIKNVVLLNPRRGVFFSENLESLCRGLGGTDSNQVMLDIIEFVSQPVSSI